MKAQGKGKESFLEESHLDNGQDCEGDGPEDFSVPECRIVVPPPSHGQYSICFDVVGALKWVLFS